MGDKRSISIDSRNTSVGCVSDEQIVGRIFARIWPLNEIGPIRRGEAVSPIATRVTEAEAAEVNVTEAEVVEAEVTEAEAIEAEVTEAEVTETERNQAL